VAKRTCCIGSLIYFPFVLIALLIVSRSTVFAHYAPSLTILIWQGISLSIVFGCAIMLWWAAKAARDAADSTINQTIALRSNALASANESRDHELVQLIEERRQKAVAMIAEMRGETLPGDAHAPCEAATAWPNGRNGEHD
jgi:hypothetical protein